MTGNYDDLPESDRLPGAPHPRFAPRVIGQDAAVGAFEAAARDGRLHHAWLVTGPKGIGKATVAWNLAGRLLSSGNGGQLAPTVAADVGARIGALSEQGVFPLRRGFDDKRGVFRAVITVDEVRALRSYFTLSRPDAGWRVVIVDSVDDLNPNAANALLKLLEEPPARSVFFLVSHSPARLLPTIRSRCRTLRCLPLGDHDLTEAVSQTDPGVAPDDLETAIIFADGSAGAALEFLGLDGPGLAQSISQLVAAMPGIRRPDAIALAESLAGRGQESTRDLFLRLIDGTVSGLARTGVTGAPPTHAGARASDYVRLSPDARAGRLWAQTQQEVLDRMRHGLAVNLDLQSLILDMVLRLDETARLCCAERTQR